MKKRIASIGILILTLCLAPLSGCEAQEQKAQAPESQIAVFSAYLQSQWEYSVYKDAVWDTRDYDAFLEDYDALTYEIWQSQTEYGTVYTYTKLVGIDTEKFQWLGQPSDIWTRWCQEDGEWCFVTNHEPAPAENVYLESSFTVELPERAMALPGGSEVDEAVYDAMTAALEEYYAEEYDRPLTAFLSTGQLFAVVVMEKEEEYRLTEYDQYQCYFVAFQAQEPDSAGLTLRYAPQLYGIDDRQSSLLELCDDMALCNAVYSFR